MPICRTSVKASKRMVYARTSERTRAIRFERPRARRRAAAARWPQEGRAPCRIPRAARLRQQQGRRQRRHRFQPPHRPGLRHAALRHARLRRQPGRARPHDLPRAGGRHAGGARLPVQERECRYEAHRRHRPQLRRGGRRLRRGRGLAHRRLRLRRRLGQRRQEIPQAARVARSVGQVPGDAGGRPAPQGARRDDDGATLRHRADPPRAAAQPRAGLDSRVSVRRGGEHVCISRQRRRRQDRTAGSPAAASGERHGDADRAVGGPLRSRGPADRPAPRRRRRSLHVQRRQHAGHQPPAGLARAAFPLAMTLAPQALRDLVRGIFARQGMSEAHAALTADVLVWADLRGMGSHGVMRVPRYVDFIRKGHLNVRPSIRRSYDPPGCVLLDAARRAGTITWREGMRAACEKAKSAGIGLALVKSTTHTAALGYYTQTAARDGFAGIALAASLPLMAYHGARAAGVSTAPLSIAVPGEEEPFALDMASSMISMGALAQARRSGQSLPEGVVLTAQGEPTVDAKTASIPLPLGGPKGSGLGFMAECLASLLTANPILAESLEQTPASKRHRQNGLVIAIDVARFVAPEMFRTQVARLTRDLRELPGDEILMPGERGSRRAAQQRDAVSIPDSVYDELKTL